MQTFGDLVTFYPHIHALVADVVFSPSASSECCHRFHPNCSPNDCTEQRWPVWLRKGLITDDFAAKLLRWEHSGSLVDNQVHVPSDDAQGRRQLARYIARKPFALEKVQYKPERACWFIALSCTPP